MKARIIVTLKSGVLDPQGKAIEGALASMGIPGVASVRQGKVFDLELAGAGQDADAVLRQACERLLANTVIENYRIEMGGADGQAAARPEVPGAAAMDDAASTAEMPAEGHP